MSEGITLRGLLDALDLALEALAWAACQAAMAPSAFLFKASSLKPAAAAAASAVWAAAKAAASLALALAASASAWLR